MSPAVLTETVWALAHEPEPVIPHRVIAVTTAAGRDQIRRLLLAPSPRLEGRPPWDALRTSLVEAGHGLDGRLRFGGTADDLRVITAMDAATGQTRELDDLRTPADNTAAADFLLEQVRAITANPDTRLVASVAGGRKTMGALLYAAVCLAARETDRVTHVLVSEPFETLRDFWYPAQPGGALARPEGRGPKAEPTFATADARIELADLPFVPLRNLFQRELGRPAGTFSRLVASCRESLRRRAAESLRVTIETRRTELEVNGTRLRLAPLEHLLLLFLASRAKQGEPAFGAYAEAVDALNAFRSRTLASAPASDFGDWRHADSLRQTWDEQDIRKAVSGLRVRLQRAGGNAPLLAPCLPERSRCSLDLPGPLLFLKD